MQSQYCQRKKEPGIAVPDAQAQSGLAQVNWGKILGDFWGFIYLFFYLSSLSSFYN